MAAPCARYREIAVRQGPAWATGPARHRAAAQEATPMSSTASTHVTVATSGARAQTRIHDGVEQIREQVAYRDEDGHEQHQR